MRNLITWIITIALSALTYLAMPSIGIWKVEGIYANRSEKTGRTHYVVFVPNLNFKLDWLKLSIPVTVTGKLKNIDATYRIDQ